MKGEAVIRSREDLMDLLGLNEQDMELARQEQEAYVRAWHLAQLRKAQGRTQRQMATDMHVSQPRIHEIENGELGKTSVKVLQAYVEALGGELEITARFGDNSYRVA